MNFRAIDLETNSLDVKTCEVAQVSIVTAPSVELHMLRDVDMLRDVEIGAEPGPSEPLPSRAVVAPAKHGECGLEVSTASVYCGVSWMDGEAAEITGLTKDMLAEHSPFEHKVRSVVKALDDPDCYVVTFNGAAFDLPIIARYAAAHGKLTHHVQDVAGQTAQEQFEELFSQRHIDVARLWQVVRKLDCVMPYVQGRHFGEYELSLTASMFAGSLTAAHGFCRGTAFEGAHDASADCLATLAVLRTFLLLGYFTIEEALRLSSSPLPGDVDFEGVFKWRGDRAVCTIGRHKGGLLEDMDRGFLSWMLKQDFHRHTKQVVTRYLQGHYPELPVN